MMPVEKRLTKKGKEELINSFFELLDCYKTKIMDEKEYKKRKEDFKDKIMALKIGVEYE